MCLCLGMCVFDLVNCRAEQVVIMECKVLVQANLPAQSSPGSHVPPVHDRIPALPLPVCFAGLE